VCICARVASCCGSFRQCPCPKRSFADSRFAACSPTQAVLRNLRILKVRREEEGLEKCGKHYTLTCIYIYIYIYIYISCLFIRYIHIYIYIYVRYIYIYMYLMKRHGIGRKRLTLKRINGSERSMYPGPIKTARANLGRNLNKSRRGGIDRSIDKLAFACRQNVTRS